MLQRQTPQSSRLKTMLRIGLMLIMTHLLWKSSLMGNQTIVNPKMLHTVEGEEKEEKPIKLYMEANVLSLFKKKMKPIHSSRRNEPAHTRKYFLPANHFITDTGRSQRYVQNRLQEWLYNDHCVIS